MVLHEKGKGKKGEGKKGGGGGGKRPSCMFGARCQKEEWDHRSQFSHPGDADYDAVAAAKQIRPSCRFGGPCTNTKQEHWDMFAHPPDTDYVQHQPKEDGTPDDALRFEGEVARYQQQGDWGFIRCTALSGMLGMQEDGKTKDLYFTKKNSNAKQLSIGQMVTFVLKEENNNGKPEAIRVELVPTPDDPPDAVRYHGIVASFIKEATWGFITCPMAKTGQDIWFHLKDCAGARIWTGMTVTFLLDEKRRPGKPEAISIKPATSSDDPPGFERIGGEVKSLIDWDNSPYGFIKGEEDELMNDKIRTLVNNKDFFFHQRDCQGAGKVFEGAKVTFLLDERSQNSAKPHAIRVKMLDPSAKPPGGAAWSDGQGWDADGHAPLGKGKYGKGKGKGKGWEGDSYEEEPNPFEMMGMMMNMMGKMKGKMKGKGKGDDYGKGKGKGKDWGEPEWGGNKRGLEDTDWGWEAEQEWQAPKAPSNVPMGVRKMVRKD